MLHAHRRTLASLLVLAALLGTIGRPARAQAQIDFSADLGSAAVDDFNGQNPILSITTQTLVPAGASIIVTAVAAGQVTPPASPACSDGTNT